MKPGHRKTNVSPLRRTAQVARQQLCNALRSATLALAAGATCIPASDLNAQESEPPRIFRGGLVQQLRSLTEDSSSKTDAPPKQSNETRKVDANPNIPKPRPVAKNPRASTPTESRTANLQANKSAVPQAQAAPSPSGSATKTSDQTGKLTVPTSRSSNEAISNKAASVGSKANRATELGVPVTNPKLANEARFQLSDKADPATAYSSNSKYDPAASRELATAEDNSKMFKESKVQPVESISQAPKVSRRPLPTNTQPVTAATAGQSSAPKRIATTQNSTSSQSTSPPASGSQGSAEPAPAGVKPFGSSYSLEQSNPLDTPSQTDKAASKSSPDYPSLQTPGFAAPGATNSRNSGGAASQPKLPQFPTPPSNLNSSSSLNSVPAKQTPDKSLDLKVPNGSLALPSFPGAGSSQPPLPSASTTLPSSTQPKLALPVPSLPAPAFPSSQLPNSAIPTPTFTSPSPSQTLGAKSSVPQSTQVPSVAPNAINPIRSNASAPATDEHMTMESPRLQVLLKGPHDMPVGAPADYQVLVRNVDDIPLDGVMLRLEIPNGVTINQGKPTHGELETERTPDGATLVTWSFADLAAYQNASAPMQLTAKSPRNFAVAMEWTLLPKSGEAQIEVRQARLELSLEGPSEAEFGVANSYRLHIRNPGSASAKNVNVKLGAASFGASDTQIDEILAGEEQAIDVELTFNERGAISINAEAVSAELKSSATIDVLVKQAVVTAAITGSERVYHGSPSMYEVRVQNSGDMDSKVVRAELALPEGAEVLTKPEGASVMGHLLTWEIPTIKVGESVAFPVELNLWTAGEQRLALACKSEHGKPSVSTIATVVEAIADLKMVINDPIAPAPVGGTVTYEMSITNRGSRSASNVCAVAQFSDGIEPTSADGAQHRIVTGQVIFEPIARIEAGETKVLRVQARASSEGTHRFRAELRSDESEMRLVQEETTQYLGSASRTARPMNQGSVIR